MSRKKIKILSVVVGIVSMFFIIALALVDAYTEYYVIFLRTGASGISYFSFTILSAAIITLVVTMYKDKQIRLFKTIVCVLIAVGIFICSSFLYAVTDLENKYYKFYSPDKKYCIIAYEWAFLLGGGVEIYEPSNVLLARKVAQLGADDGYRFIKHHNYSIEWDKNIVTFTVGSGSGYKDTVIIELKQK